MNASRGPARPNDDGGAMYTPQDSEKRIHKDKAVGPMLPIGQACRLLNVHANTLRRWSAKGLIREYRIGPGKHRRFRADEITALILEQSTYRQAKANKPTAGSHRATR